MKYHLREEHLINNNRIGQLLDPKDCPHARALKAIGFEYVQITDSQALIHRLTDHGNDVYDIYNLDEKAREGIKADCFIIGEYECFYSHTITKEELIRIRELSLNNSLPEGFEF